MAVVDPVTLITDARTYAQSAQTAAIDQLGQAIDTINSIPSAPTIGAIPAPVDPPVPGDPGAVPEYTGTHFNPGDNPFTGVAPTLADVPPYVPPTDPGEAPAALAYTDQPKPTEAAGDPTLLQGIPTITDIGLVPTAPDLLGEIHAIAKPVILPITIPDAPAYVAPQFLGVSPTSPGPAPTGLDVTLRTNYETINPVMRQAVSAELDAFLDREFPAFRSGMAAIESRLATYLAGGSALSPAVENAIYNRALDKVNANTRRADRKLYGESARRGHTIPPAILLNQIQDNNQEGRNALANAAVEIAVEQAKLEQNNLQFAVTASSALRHTAINAGLAYYTGLVQINGQALEYARSVVDSIFKAYDLATKYSEIQARIYESEAHIYAAKVQGALAELDAYKAKIAGLEAQANVDTAMVNIYTAQVHAVEAEANVYRAQLEALTVKAGIERLKVEIYDAKVQAYGHQVNAYTARWQGYEAAVRGEQAKQGASAELQRSYQSKVQAFTERIKAAETEILSVLKTNEGLLNQYKTEADVYATLTNASVEAVRAEILSYDSTLHGYTAKAQATSERARAFVARYQAIAEQIINASRLFVTTLQESYRQQVATTESVAHVSVIAGESYSRLAQSALSGMNSLASTVTENVLSGNL